MLLQRNDEEGQWEPLAFTAKRLKPSELKYTVSGKECLAVVHALRSWRRYVQGEEIEVHTDHQALVWLMDAAQLHGRLARWVWTIQNIPFTIAHRAGNTLVVADALSRDVFPPPTCPHCLEVLRAIREAALPEPSAFVSSSLDTVERQRAELDGDSLWSLDDDGRVLRRTHTGSKTWVPEVLKEKVLQHFHGNQLHGHYGTERTMDKISERFWWRKMEERVKEFIKRCSVCAQERVPRPNVRQGKHVTYQARRRGEIVAVDVLTITPSSTAGHTKVLVIADAFTRWCVTTPIIDETASTVAQELYTKWFCVFGPPEKLLSDRGRTFAGKVIERICSMCPALAR